MGKPWFRRKRIGFGAAPLTWQGWLVTLIFALTVAGLLRGLGRLPAGPVLLAVVAVTIAFLVLVWNKTEGGWRPPTGG